MLDSSANYKNAVYSQERMFKSRASIKMDAFSDIEGKAFTLITDMSGKVVGSTVEVPHIAKYVKSSLLRPPTYTGFVEVAQSGYNGIDIDDTSYTHITGTTSGTYSQALFSFNLIEYLERTYGKVLWAGATALADKIAIAKKYITSMYGTCLGYGTAPVRPVFKNFRYIRDWLNGNTVNGGNYWNEIQCLAGATNRAAGKTPTLSSGTLNNPTNLTDGNTATYCSEVSANGVAKYVQIDLGAVYTDIDTIKVYHYYADGRTFHGTKTEISLDGYNWYPIFDSAVSGEYAETSAGKVITGSSGGNGMSFTIWDQSKNNWASEVSHTSSSVTGLTRTTSYPANCIDDNGWVHFLAWANISNGTTASDLVIDWVKLTIEGALTDIRIYDDSTIMRMTIIDDMSVLNDTLPANELDITFNNEAGELDLLNFSNMQKVIASKPEIRVEMGIVTTDIEGGTLIGNLAGKVRTSVIENPHSAWYKSGGQTTQLTPTDVLSEFSQTAYDEVKTAESWTIGINTTLTAGNMAQYLFSFDVLEMLERQFGPQIWMNKTTLADKVALARNLVTRIDFRVDGKGSSYAGPKATLSRWNLTDWYGTWFNTTDQVTTVTGYTTTPYNGIDDNGFTHLLFRSEPSDGVIASNITADYAEITLTFDPSYAVEWIPMGTYFLTDWQNDVTSRIISMTCHDYFEMLTDINYNPTSTTNLGILAQEVLAAGGVPSSNWLIDSSLYSITVNPFPERIDCRTALQHIGIAARAAVFQDRNGNVVIKPFRAIDEETNYISYPSSQGQLYGYPSPNTYIVNSTGGGMKYLDFEQMYDAPQVSLEKSVYQLVVKIYATVGADPTESVYTNATIEGNNGSSFTIDNPLINTTDLASKVAAWYIREINYNALYSVNWRQNPILECADMILVEDSFGAEKQTRIYRQQFDYEGYLSGITESRGGV